MESGSSNWNDQNTWSDRLYDPLLPSSIPAYFSCDWSSVRVWMIYWFLTKHKMISEETSLINKYFLNRKISKGKFIID